MKFKFKALIAFIFGICIGCSFIQERTMVKQCHIYFTRLWVTDISFSDITVRIKLKIRNDTEMDVTIDSINAKLYLNDIEGGDIKFDGVSIKSHDASVAKIYVTFTYKQLKADIKELIKKRSKINYRFVGVANIQSPIGEIKYPFDFKKIKETK